MLFWAKVRTHSALRHLDREEASFTITEKR
jgi:hypothetical protein